MSTRPITSPICTYSPERWALAAFDVAPTAMMIVDANAFVVDANVEAERAFSRSRSELLGSPVDAIVAPEDRTAMRVGLSTVVAAPIVRPARHELVGLRGFGERFPIEVSFGKLDSTPSSLVIVMIHDLSDQRRVEQHHRAVAAAAADATARVAAMLECAPAFIIAFDREGVIDFINRTLPQYTKADCIGKHWRSFFAPEQQAVILPNLEEMYATESPQLFEVHTPGPDGRPVYFDTQIAPVRVGGAVVGAILVSQDVTERKQVQTELLANRHMALLGTLAAGVAHEINTPIQFVRDNVEFMSGAVNDLLTLIETFHRLRSSALAGTPLGAIIEEAARAEETADLPYLRGNLPAAFGSCLDGMNKIAQIVRSLKDFAHPPDEEKLPTDLNRLVQTALTIATNEYKMVADLDAHYAEMPPIVCHGAEISQVLLNIVVNAAHAIGDVVKGTKQRGRITVATRYEHDAAIIDITDTGCGIPDAIKSRIFDPFFTTKEVGKGTGQGLSIAWSMVKKRHGGDITFDSEVGRGTTFTVRLPNAYSAPHSSTPNSTP